MLTKQLRKMFGFNIWQKLKHPQNPNLTNFNSDALDPRPSNAWVGRVFVPKSQVRKDPIGKYKDEIVNVVFNFLHKKHGDQFKLKFDNYEDVKNDSWYAHNIKLDQEIPALIDALCEEIVLKEHSYRFAIEKMNRKKYLEAYVMKKGKQLKQISLQQFFYDVSEVFEFSVDQCKKSREERPVYNMENLKKQVNFFTYQTQKDILDGEKNEEEN